MKDCVKCRKNQCVNCEGGCGCGNTDHKIPIRSMSALEQALKVTLMNREFTPRVRANQAVVQIAATMTVNSEDRSIDLTSMAWDLMERESVA